MNPILLTVPNTGTHFAQSILEQRFDRHYFGETIRNDRHYWFSHAEQRKCAEARRLIENGAGPLILTMRNPIDNIRSRWKRGYKLDADWELFWRNLFLIAEDFDHFWLPIDTEDRDEYLDMLSEALDFPFKTDWEPRGVYTPNGREREIEDDGLTMDEALDYLSQFPFEQFGYDLWQPQHSQPYITDA